MAETADSPQDEGKKDPNFSFLSDSNPTFRDPLTRALEIDDVTEEVKL